MRLLLLCMFLCLSSSAYCWDFPGHPGEDCPTARERMLHDPENQWMIPKCEKDGTFQDLQCYDQYPEVKDTCMCVAPDGSPLTLPGFGLDVKSCVCFNEYNKISQPDHEAEMPECEKDGYFSPLQCSKASKKCWCVDKFGKVLVPPSTEVHSCNN